MSTINTQNTIQRYLELKQSNVPVLVSQVPKDINNFVMERNKKQTQKVQLSFWAGAVALSALITEFRVANAKKQLVQGSKELIDKIKFIRKMHLFAPVMFGIATLFAYQETQVKKRAGIITKEQIYKSQGIDVSPDSVNSRIKISTGEYIAMAVGAGLVIIKSVSKKKYPIPTFEMNFFENSKVLRTACDAIANGVGLAGIYSIGKSIFPNKKSS